MVICGIFEDWLENWLTLSRDNNLYLMTETLILKSHCLFVMGSYALKRCFVQMLHECCFEVHFCTCENLHLEQEVVCPLQAQFRQA